MLGGSVSQTATSDSVFHPSHPPYPPPSQLESNVSRSTNTSSSSANTPSYSHRNANAASTAPHPAATHDSSSSSMTPNTSQNPHHYRSHSQQQTYPQHGGGGAGLPLMNNTPRNATVSSSPTSPRSNNRSSRPHGGSGPASPTRIKVRDLSHIQSFASEELLDQSRGSRGQSDVGRQYEISSMPVQDIIEMVAGLLTKITTTNDLQHEHVHRHIPPPEGTAGLSPQTTSVLAFHGKNVPSITILSYLSRIHKYCPTTYEVFLSLLVYFDRMTETVNKTTLQSLQQRADPIYTPRDPAQRPSSSSTPSQPSTHPPVVTPPSSARMDAQDTHSSPPTVPPSLSLTEEEESLSHYFVVDSFNIHRLVIAGVTCASKFFSDVFYTNSRYAKVGGLPLVELNHLELQFLLLNDFRLSVPVEELEAYGTMLVEFYAREVVAQQQQQQQQEQAAFAAPPSSSSSSTSPANSHGEDVQMGGTRGAGDNRTAGGVGVSQTPTPP
ncbi:hypothetical protein FQN54_006493 [Arachnomyces sp. PD_36]|nr:hypothetical protein FQN54_006493 [Arachnomyces sp. PD_36]